VNIDGVTIHLHVGDLSGDVRFADAVAIDTETMGLRPERDRLCLVQLSAGDGTCHMVHFPPRLRPADGTEYDAPNLKALLADPAVTKLFHFARFDVATLARYLGVVARPVYCTKIASKLARTYTDRHGLKDLYRELLDIDLSKEQQSSDWGIENPSDAQFRYAAGDVLHLHALRERLDAMIDREGRTDLAAACFGFLPDRARLDLAGWPDEDIFAH